MTTDKNKQTEANKRWQEKNKERAKYLSNRSRARSFIRNMAAKEDIKEFRELLDERENTLKNLSRKKVIDMKEIFEKYGINIDWLDVLEEEGKVNLGNLDDLSIIDEINDSTDYTAYFSNDFGGGVVIEK
ncbi:hypothetical protein I6N96_08850 [Enterococcus sp. BWM-S5]|uniref:Uncharacterized protein n=1 Tax=Enterococcus larvae TaxID=2794352 RepID=A0ABS4CJD9_9ENTE|nr:hypothetical protein [Enterococcus larvae]